MRLSAGELLLLYIVDRGIVNRQCGRQDDDFFTIMLDWSVVKAFMAGGLVKNKPRHKSTFCGALVKHRNAAKGFVSVTTVSQYRGKAGRTTHERRPTNDES